MFCVQCGNALRDSDCFCAQCGAPVSRPSAPVPTPSQSKTRSSYSSGAPYGTPSQTRTAPAGGTYYLPDHPSPEFMQYLHNLELRTGQKARYIPELYAYSLYTERFSAALSKIKQYIYVTQNDTADYGVMQAFSQACTHYTLETHDGIPRGLVTGIGCYNIMFQTRATQGACDFSVQLPEKHFAAFEMPIVADLSSHQLIYCTRTPVYGCAMWGGIRKVARENLGF